jgi:F-type H+-transporting ATPase subunit b
MEKLGVNLGFFLFQVFNFTIMAVLLYAWAYKPILKMLKTRREKIAQGLEDAQVAAQARANAEQEAAKIISEAQAKSAQIIRDATERAESVGREVKTGIDAEIAKEREAALADVQVERERILGELRGQVAALSIAAAQKLVGETLDEKRQHTLLDEFFSGVRSGRVVVLESSRLGGSSAEVTSALPLTNEEKETVKKDVLSKIGSQATVTFRVDPTILGGIVIRAGGKMLDASVAGQLESMRQKLSS